LQKGLGRCKAYYSFHGLKLQDFKSAVGVPKKDVSKLGPGQYQSWTASIHDKIYSQY